MDTTILLNLVLLASIFGFSSAYTNVTLQRKSVKETTTTVGGKIKKCVESCRTRTTSEYNPVCGSDGKTYDIERKLFCAKSCGVDVTVRRRSVCPRPIPDDGDSRQGRLLPTTTPHIGRTTPLSEFTKCMRRCDITPSFTFVCGTDLITYMNMDRLKCAQSCGKVVEVLCEKPCAACGSKPVTTTLSPTTTTLSPTTTTLSPTTTTLSPTTTTLPPTVPEQTS